nr:alkaline phosphatase D family protein [Pseudoxanthomonas suwonensis]
MVEIAETPDFAHLVAGGRAAVGPDTDWTCRFLATGLAPGREYWYRFVDEHGFASRTGRTLTAPADDADTAVRFAFASCQAPNESSLQAYRRMLFEDERAPAEQRLQFVLHLGDFIYEVTWYAEDNPGGTFRGRRLRDRYRFPDGEKVGNFHLPVSLEDYRTLYRSYLEDPDLQDARARWPFVCVWDNHEFAWAGYQSQYVAPGVNRPSQRKKVIANQAWWEFIPARVVKPGDPAVDRFDPPAVEDTPITRFDADGLGDEPNNLAAIRSLRIQRTLRFGRNVELFLTDHHSFRSPAPDGSAFGVPGTRFVSPESVEEILDAGRTYDGGHPPDTIAFLGQALPNPAKDGPAQTYLGREQREWLLERLGASTARWKIWGHSFGTLTLHSDYQHLPAGTGVAWPDNQPGQDSPAGVYSADSVAYALYKHACLGPDPLCGDRHEPLDPAGADIPMVLFWNWARPSVPADLQPRLGPCVLADTTPIPAWRRFTAALSGTWNDFWSGSQPDRLDVHREKCPPILTILEQQLDDPHEVRLELSQPTAMSDADKVSDWSTRFILPPLQFGPEWD